MENFSTYSEKRLTPAKQKLILLFIPIIVETGTASHGCARAWNCVWRSMRAPFIFVRGERPMASAGDVKKTVINAFRAASAQKSELTVGRCLLNGRHWNGAVNFSYTMQMRMVERSLGGWRTITASY